MSEGKSVNKHPPLSEMPPARVANSDSSRANLPNQKEMKRINALNLEPASRESQSTAKSRADRQPLSGKGGDRSGKSSKEGASPAGDQSRTALNPSAKEFSLNSQAPSFTLPGVPARQTALSAASEKPMVPIKLSTAKLKLGLDDILSACFHCMQSSESSEIDLWPIDHSAPKYNRILGQYTGPAPTMPGGLSMAAAAAMQQQQQQQHHHQQQQQQQQPQWPPGPQGLAGNAGCGGPCNNNGPMGPPNGGGGGGGYSQTQNMQGMGQGAMMMMMPQGVMPNMQAQQGAQQGGMQPQMFFMPTNGGGGYMVQNGQGQPGMQQQQGMQMGGMFPQGDMQQMGMQGGGVFQPGGNMQMQQGMQMPRNMIMGGGCGGMNGGGGKP